jgi:L-ascorbate metabolism protein UlaG (beta-lactamase superfamily)
MAPVLEPLARGWPRTRGGRVECWACEPMFGETVTTAGLLPGADMLDALRGGAFDVVLLPAESLNDDDLFIDNLPLAELTQALAPARVVPAHELTSALAGL